MSLYDTLLERSGGHAYNGYFTMTCVFHDDHSPSLFVYEKGQDFKCRSCGKYGSLSLLNRVLNTGVVVQAKSIHTVIPRFRKWIEKYETLEEIAFHAHRFLKAHKEFQGYLRQRKMDWAIEPGKFGYMDGWLTLPVFDPKGQVIDIVCRSIGNKENSPRYVLMKPQKDVEPPLYSPNWKRVQEADEVFVPFGIFDSWALEALEKPSITGTAGKSISVNQIYKLGKQVRFVPDRGEESDAYDIANRLGWRAIVRCLKFPNGAKDLDETRRKFGNETLLSLLEA